MLGLRKFGACSAVSVGRLTLVEGGLVWRLVAKAWAFEVTFLCRLGRLMRIYTPKDTGAIIRIANTIKRFPTKKSMFPIKKTTKRNSM